MSTVTISRTEYKKLKDDSARYESVRRFVENDIFSPPPTRDAKVVMRSFEATGRYSKKFLESLQRGLARSSYFKK